MSCAYKEIMKSGRILWGFLTTKTSSRLGSLNISTSVSTRNPCFSKKDLEEDLKNSSKVIMILESFSIYRQESLFSRLGSRKNKFMKAMGPEQIKVLFHQDKI